MTIYMNAVYFLRKAVPCPHGLSDRRRCPNCYLSDEEAKGMERNDHKE